MRVGTYGKASATGVEGSLMPHGVKASKSNNKLRRKKRGCKSRNVINTQENLNKVFGMDTEGALESNKMLISPSK